MSEGPVRFYDLASSHQRLGIEQELRDAAVRVVDSGSYVLGPEVDAFEAEFARYCGAGHAVGVGSGLSALELALRAHDVGPGDEVLVPSHTFIATWLAVTSVGATPVPVEPGPGDASGPEAFLVDAAAAEQACTPRTRAVVPVSLYGHPVDVTAFGALARSHGLAVVVDAAQAHGALTDGRPAAADVTAAYSFYPGKNLGALGDGGAVTTPDADVAERIRTLRSYGARTKYQHDEWGTNARLDELQAAVLRVKLAHLDAWNARRREIARRYTAALADVPGVRVPGVTTGSEPVWHQYVLRCDRRDALADALAADGVETLVHYPVPVHRSGAYADAGHMLPRAGHLAASVLSLPIGPHLRDDEVERVADAVRRAAASVHSPSGEPA